MAPLRDPQQERFCRELVEQYLAMPPSSTPIPTAYEAAGYQPSRKNSYHLAQRPEIQRRIQELLAEALAYPDIRISEAAVKLDHYASARITDFYDEGGVLKDPASLPPQLADAVCKVEYHANGGHGDVDGVVGDDRRASCRPPRCFRVTSSARTLSGNSIFFITTSSALRR
jgi:hypothetical protein